jgi:hypothetical protein
MSCHLCDKSAIGLCRQCFKFYCHEHGDGFCASCQQKGWQEEKITAISTVSLWATDQERAFPTTENTVAETTQDDNAEKSANTEVIAAESVVGYHSSMGFMSQEIVEELTAPELFVKLLPIFGVARASDVLMMIKGIELYQEAFTLDIVMHFGASTDNGIHRHLTPGEVSLQDDLETVYTLNQRGGGGNNREYTQNFIITPALNPAAAQLIIQVPRLEVMEHFSMSGRRGRSEPKRIILVGPWKIVCPIPSEKT